MTALLLTLALSSYSVTLTWFCVTKVNVYRKPAQAAQYELKATNVAGIWEDEHVVSGKTYDYEVCNAAGCAVTTAVIP